MATEIRMPQLSDTMSSGKIINWNKREGDAIQRGDILAEVETDKANLEIESFQQGTLIKIVVPANSAANVGEVICYVGQPGEQLAGQTASAAPATPPPAASPTPPAASASPAPQVTMHAPTNGNAAHDSGGRTKVSPLARKLAEQYQVDLTNVAGSGPDGRIVKRDIELAKGRGPAAAAPSSPASSAPASAPAARPAPRPDLGPPGQGTLTPLTKMRETIANRMQQSVHESPHFYVTTSIDMGEVSRLREILKAKAEFKGISLNHMIVKASAYALANEPRVNRTIRNGNMVFEPAEINIGIITAIEDGLIIPVLRSVDKMSLKDVVFEARAALDRARAGRPLSTDLLGGTFSISNMGMFDVENFTAIINPGQGAVLAVSSTKEVPMVRSGQVIAGLQMKVTLSVDHRVIDGVMAGTFLKHFKEALENPALLML